MKIFSSAFGHNQPISKRYTGEGDDLSPPLGIEEVPKGAQSLALIVDDPDAPMGTFVHWVTWNIDPKLKQLAEGCKAVIEGKNDFGDQGYRGPLPPPGPSHRYFFKLYALDTLLDLPEGSTKEELLNAMEGHILERAELIGTYRR